MGCDEEDLLSIKHPLIKNGFELLVQDLSIRAHDSAADAGERHVEGAGLEDLHDFTADWVITEIPVGLAEGRILSSEKYWSRTFG